MNEKDVEVIKILAELDLYEHKPPTGTVDHFIEALRIAHLTEEEHFLEDVAKLFQTPLQEMAFKTGLDFPDYTEQQLVDIIDYIKNAKEITKFEEGGRFTLYQKDDFYILRNNKGDITYGWARIKQEIYNERPYDYLKIIYILPQYRKSGVALVLFHAVKEIVNGKVIIDGPVFPKGEEFINSLAKKGIYTIWSVDKKTHQRKKYEPGAITFDPKGDLIMIENKQEGLFIQVTPGSDFKTYFSRYPEVIID
ncbi:MAG: hypothetical protein ACREAU_00550 [Nitrosopumilaceae archaeon]